MRKTLLAAVLSTMFTMTADVRAAEQKTGTIVSLDAAAKTFICQWGAECRSNKTPEKTEFPVGTKNGAWSDLKMGDRVNILYRVVEKDRDDDRVTIEKR